MVVGILNLKLRFPGNDSLKGKRMILRSLKDRLKNTFNVSVAEVGDQDHWTLSQFALASVGQDRKRVESVISKALGFIRSDRSVEVLEENIELL